MRSFTVYNFFKSEPFRGDSWECSFVSSLSCFVIFFLSTAIYEQDYRWEGTDSLSPWLCFNAAMFSNIDILCMF